MQTEEENKERVSVVYLQLSKQIESIKERGKDHKGQGPNQDFFESIVKRLEYNLQVIKDLQDEHTSIQAQLAEIKENYGVNGSGKNSNNKATASSVEGEEESKDETAKSQTTKAEWDKDQKEQKEKKLPPKDLHTEIAHLTHAINLLKKQIDIKEYEIKEDMRKMEDTNKLIMAIKNEEKSEGLALRVEQLTNRLDNVIIKNQETDQLFKAYNGIAFILEKQKMHWNPIIDGITKSIKQNERDLKELTLISRDSKRAWQSAKNQHTLLKKASDESTKNRQDLLKKKEEKMGEKPRNTGDQGDNSQGNMSVKNTTTTNRSSIAKDAKKTKQLIDEKAKMLGLEENKLAEIKDYFGTDNPDEIADFFAEKRNSSISLDKQIKELEVQCEHLEKKLSHERSKLEETEYASTKGIGGNRLILEGRKLLEQKRATYDEVYAMMRTEEKHHKLVLDGLGHLSDIMALLIATKEDVEAASSPITFLQWISSKVARVQNLLEIIRQNEKQQPVGEKGKKPGLGLESAIGQIKDTAGTVGQPIKEADVCDIRVECDKDLIDEYAERLNTDDKQANGNTPIKPDDKTPDQTKRIFKEVKNGDTEPRVLDRNAIKARSKTEAGGNNDTANRDKKLRTKTLKA